jgi:uncharacterized protein
MQQTIQLKLLPSEAADPATIRQCIAQTTGNRPEAVTGFHIAKRSIDARSRTIWVNLSVTAFINEPFVQRPRQAFAFRPVGQAAKSAVIVGAGPAGLFAALWMLEAGIRPIVLERGKDVRARRRDLATLNKGGLVNPESNYCFGEGGAGTYSDGKLYTRSNKRGDINRILQLFVHFGADESILYEAHPHIGTNKLPQIISAMRQQVLDCGGIFLFEQKVTGLVVQGNRVTAVQTASGGQVAADAFVLATGHSARDVFELLHRQRIAIEAKPFALGVRIEHPQALIDGLQYHTPQRNACLPPASYSLVQQVDGRGVFSFCMCPGGIIAPAATAPGELVVNGWSPSKRNNPFANSGMVVQVQPSDAFECLAAAGAKPDMNDPLLLLRFQQMVEQRAYAEGGGQLVAPAQRMADFCSGKTSATLPHCSYLPGINSADLRTVLPAFVHRALAGGFAAFGNKMKGYFTNEAVVVATESRTSSPVRIPRQPNTLAHPQLRNLYPCGEGAGYAGGIVSAAMDGERVAQAIAVSIGT